MSLDFRGFQASRDRRMYPWVQIAGVDTAWDTELSMLCGDVDGRAKTKKTLIHQLNQGFQSYPHTLVNV